MSSNHPTNNEDIELLLDNDSANANADAETGDLVGVVNENNQVDPSPPLLPLRTVHQAPQASDGVPLGSSLLPTSGARASSAYTDGLATAGLYGIGSTTMHILHAGITSAMKPSMELVQLAGLGDAERNSYLVDLMRSDEDNQKTAGEIQQFITKLADENYEREKKNLELIRTIEANQAVMKKNRTTMINHSNRLQEIYCDRASIEAKKNAIEKLKKDQIKVFQSMNPVTVLKLVNLDTDQGWSDIGFKKLVLIVKGLNKLGFHKNPKIRGSLNQNQQRMEFNVERRMVPTGQGGSRRESVAEYKAYLQHCFKYKSPQSRNPGPTAGRSRDATALTVPSNRNKRKAEDAVLTTTESVGGTDMDIIDAKKILDELDVETLNAIEECIEDLGYVPRRLSAVVEAVPHSSALLKFLLKFKVGNPGACRDILEDARDNLGSKSSNKRRRLADTGNSVVNQGQSIGAWPDGELHPMGDSAASTTGAGNPSLSSDHDDDHGALETPPKSNKTPKA